MGLRDKVTGRVKQAAGDLTGDKGLQRKGRQEERKGDAQGRVGSRGPGGQPPGGQARARQGRDPGAVGRGARAGEGRARPAASAGVARQSHP